MRNEEREIIASNIEFDPLLYLSRQDKKVTHWDIFLVTPSERRYFYGHVKGRKRDKLVLNDTLTLVNCLENPEPKIRKIVLSQRKMRSYLRAAVLLRLQAPRV